MRPDCKRETRRMDVRLLLILFASLASGQGVREHTLPALRHSFILVALIYFVPSSQWADVNETTTPRDGEWAWA